MPNRAITSKIRATAWICVGLVFITLVSYWGVLSAQFVDYDDDHYVLNNPYVRAGVTADGLSWALKARAVRNWHPLTWCSHMLDCTLFGLNPAGPHAENLAFHVANTLVLFLLLRRLTSAQWRSAFVAALFAVHPLHVESVAWVSERKDVLSTFLLFLTLFAYTKYVEQSPTAVEGPRSSIEGCPSAPSRVLTQPRLSTLDPRPIWNLGTARYGLVLLLFALALMAKPMVVTLPFLLLLLDFWPLNRHRNQGSRTAGWAWLAIEKLPLFALAAISCILTLWAQSLAATAQLPMGTRIANAAISCGRYLLHTVWPVSLYINYPYPRAWPSSAVILMSALILTFSFYVLHAGNRHPFLMTGWFWYLGLLLPVIGIVQVGIQSMADRYTYVPLIGIFIIVAWSGYELVRTNPLGRVSAGIAASLAVAACIPLTIRQVGFWRDSSILFEHALRMDPENFIVENNFAVVLARKGDLQGALAHLQHSASINPSYPETYANMGRVQFLLGKYPDAAASYQRVLDRYPNRAREHYGLALVLERTGDAAGAEEHLAAAIRLDPGFREASEEYDLLRKKLGKSAVPPGRDP